MPRNPRVELSNWATQACSASAVASTSNAPMVSAWATTAAIDVAASVRLWVTLEIRLAPWLSPTMNRLGNPATWVPVSYTHLRAHETVLDLVCRLLLEKKKEEYDKRIK